MSGNVKTRDLLQPRGIRRSLQEEEVQTQETISRSAIPEGFVLVVDTREQNPFFLGKRPMKGLIIVRETLLVGDYSVRGMEHLVGVERKNLLDFYGSITNGRDRFKRMLEVMKDYPYKILIIESPFQEVLQSNRFTEIHPRSVFQTLISLQVRYGLPIVYAHTRAEAELYTLNYLIKCYTVHHEPFTRKGEKHDGRPRRRIAT